jgi:hypothetical protein
MIVFNDFLDSTGHIAVNGGCGQTVPVGVFRQAVDIHAKGFALVSETEAMCDQHLPLAD